MSKKQITDKMMIGSRGKTEHAIIFLHNGQPKVMKIKDIKIAIEKAEKYDQIMSTDSSEAMENLKLLYDYASDNSDQYKDEHAYIIEIGKLFDEVKK